MTKATENDDSPAWAPLCTAGAFSMTIHTRLSALASGLRHGLHPHASFLAIVACDDGTSFQINFVNADDLRLFIRETEPTGIVILRSLAEAGDAAHVATGFASIPDDPSATRH